jgi:hypothetical protein
MSWRAGASPAFDPPNLLSRPRAAAVASNASNASGAPAARASSARPPAARAPQPRASADEAACYGDLSEQGVAFRRVAKGDAPGLAWPIQLTAALDGVLIHGGKKNAPTNYLDCRLARALLAWTPSLRAQGVVGLAHLSMYRRNAVVAGTSKQSGHALGRAIDVARFEMRDGRELSVLHDWTNRTRGADPCQAWPSDNDAARTMRKLVCAASELEVFQTVLTPHYNDAHNNHVHLELSGSGDDAWIG